MFCLKGGSFLFLSCWSSLMGRYYVTPAVLSLGDLRPSAEFSGKMHKFLRSLAEYLAALTLLCCHYIFDSYITSLTLSFYYLYDCVLPFTLILCMFIVFNIILDAFKSILSQFRCSLEPVNFVMAPAGVSEHTQTPQLCWHLLHSLFCQLYSLLGSCVIVAYRAPNWRKPATHKHFFSKQTCLKNEWRNSLHY